MTMPQTSSLGHAPVKRGFIRQLGVDTVYSIFGLVLAVMSFTLIITGLALGIGLLITVIGFAVLALTMLIARGLADMHRIGIGGVLGRPSPRPAYRKSQPGDGWFRKTLSPLRDPQSWLDVLAGIIDLPFAIFAFVVAVVWWAAGLGGITYGLWDWSLPHPPDNKNLNDFLGLGHSAAARIWTNEVLGVIFVLTLPFAIRGAAMLRAIIARALLSGIAEMRHQIVGLQEQNKAAASAEVTALRRLERDIHDGPQQRLVRLAMDLGRAKQQLDSDPAAARATIEEALGQTRETLDELRALSRGIAPPILADRGLESALAALAGRNPVPVDLAIAPNLGKLTASVETTAYFVVAEALTNTAKHSAAQACTVTVARNAGLVGVVVTDDGQGGAHVAKGHGLAGLADRVRAASGTLTVTSPIGGPTEIRAELPCE